MALKISQKYVTVWDYGTWCETIGIIASPPLNPKRAVPPLPPPIEAQARIDIGAAKTTGYQCKLCMGMKSRLGTDEPKVGRRQCNGWRDTEGMLEYRIL